MFSFVTVLLLSLGSQASSDCSELAKSAAFKEVSSRVNMVPDFHVTELFTKVLSREKKDSTVEYRVRSTVRMVEEAELVDLDLVVGVSEAGGKCKVISVSDTE